VVRGKLPLLVTVMDTANVVRPPGAKKIMKYKKARCASELARELDQAMPAATVDDKAARLAELTGQYAQRGLLIEQWGLDEVEADLTWCGRDGSPTKVHHIQSLVLKGGSYKEYAPTHDGVTALVGELIEDHTIG
jgi:electron transfer flavoprotein beta subunit